MTLSGAKSIPIIELVGGPLCGMSVPWSSLVSQLRIPYHVNGYSFEPMYRLEGDTLRKAIYVGCRPRAKGTGSPVGQEA